MSRILRKLFLCVAAFAAGALAHAAPDHVDITWMSIANMHFALGRPADPRGRLHHAPAAGTSSIGGATGVASTHRAVRPDVAAVTEVFEAIGGKSGGQSTAHRPQPFRPLVRHGHLGAALRGAHHRLADDLPAGARREDSRAALHAGARRREVHARAGVDMYVIRWNHSGDPAKNPEQHESGASCAMSPCRTPAGALRAGVAEDFPNGGGNRAYLFTVDGPQGRFSWLFQDSASAVDLREPIVVDGQQLRRAARESARGHEGGRARLRGPVDRYRRT